MKAAIIYWSGTGNTELMAQYIASGIEDEGGEAEVMTVSDADGRELDEYDALVFGCPAMGAEELEETEFEPYFAGIEDTLGGRKTALFGSYGWGSGDWMRSWEERVRADGAALVCDGLIVCGEPGGDECRELAKSIVK